MPDDFIVVRRLISPQARKSGKDASFRTRAFESSPDAWAEVEAQKTIAVEVLDDQQLRELSRDDGVEAVARAMPTRSIAPVATSAAHDGTAWGIDAVGVAGSNYNASSVCVAMLDTGIARGHPAFRGIKFTKANVIDYTAGGAARSKAIAAMPVGHDFDGHGTHCAATIFGREVDGVRIGVAPNLQRVFIGKVLDAGSGSSAALFAAMEDAIRYGANVISMSLGFDFPGMVQKLTEAGWPADLATSRALEGYRDNLEVFNAIQQKVSALARMGEGAIIVAATGNESRVDQDPRHRIGASLPAAANGVIRVGALARRDDGKYRVAPFSNAGASLCAPGVGILSARASGGLIAMDGTSMAAPHVAGLAALWISAVANDGPPRDLISSATQQMLAGTRRNVIVGSKPDVYGEGLVYAPLNR